MATSYSFHPEALFEYAGATNYFLHEASPRVAERFVTAVESVVAALVVSMQSARWRRTEDRRPACHGRRASSPVTTHRTVSARQAGCLPAVTGGTPVFRSPRVS